MYPPLAQYIPTGTFIIGRDFSTLSPEQWISPELLKWRALSHGDDARLIRDASGYDLLGRDVQAALFRSASLRLVTKLFEQLWIKLEFQVSEDKEGSIFGTVRVYVLPDDVDRRRVSRTEPSLRKLRHRLLSRLDFSASAWDGRPGESSDLPRLYDQRGEEPDTNETLLELFNTIPSPDPRPLAVEDESLQDAMNSLLRSKISGLKTTLWPYQRRSAALMVQREAAPDRVIDPRLDHVVDQHGAGWYYDHASGLVLKQPRYYDGVPGGILAEEMGTGKTIICLALILATRHHLAFAPNIHENFEVPVRPRVGSLADMAAACATRNSVPWRSHFDYYTTVQGSGLTGCIDALRRNPGLYFVPSDPPRRSSRRPPPEPWSRKVYMSSTTLLIVPKNLSLQWMQEIQKHTEELRVLTLVPTSIPLPEEMMEYDIIICQQTAFESLQRDGGGVASSNLANIHFARCIVDEGHRLGNSRITSKSDLLLGLEALRVSSRWIVTGTPSHGLYGVDESSSAEHTPVDGQPSSPRPDRLASKKAPSVAEQERRDLERIGSIAALYLKARPWANTTDEKEDTLAEWNVYAMQPKHNSRSKGQRAAQKVIRETMSSLIIRHPISETGKLLPTVSHKIVLLDGSYQDRLSLNLFAMFITFNAVQSQRTDLDYFFHHRQRKFLTELISNLKQATFFGGSFFSREEITRAIETAEKFLQEGKVPISAEDQQLLQLAVEFGRRALGNQLHHLSNIFHEMPLYVRDLPPSIAASWALDQQGEKYVLTDARLLLALQKLLAPCIDAPNALQVLLSGERIKDQGTQERWKALHAEGSGSGPDKGGRRPAALAGNTQLGNGRAPSQLRSNALKSGPDGQETPPTALESDIAAPLAKAQLVATVSAKLSYLLDAVEKYQKTEQILIFYDNENTAFHIAVALDVLQIQYLIYAKSLSTERKTDYVNTFNHNPRFRVLLMDITQAAFGLDMKAASRIYFINPVLNPQVEAQAIGRARRISQQKPVTVETLVLRDSIDEMIVERKNKMTQAEHRKCKSLLDDRPIYNWMQRVKVTPMEGPEPDGLAQVVPLEVPQYIFGRGLAREEHPDEGLLLHFNPSKPVLVQATPADGTITSSSGIGTDASSTGASTVETNGSTAPPLLPSCLSAGVSEMSGASTSSVSPPPTSAAKDTVGSVVLRPIRNDISALVSQAPSASATGQKRPYEEDGCVSTQADSSEDLPPTRKVRFA